MFKKTESSFTACTSQRQCEGDQGRGVRSTLNAPVSVSPITFFPGLKVSRDRPRLAVDTAAIIHSPSISLEESEKQ